MLKIIKSHLSCKLLSYVYQNIVTIPTFLLEFQLDSNLLGFESFRNTRKQNNFNACEK